MAENDCAVESTSVLAPSAPEVKVGEGTRTPRAVVVLVSIELALGLEETRPKYGMMCDYHCC
jgi:hypothetical protein